MIFTFFNINKSIKELSTSKYDYDKITFYIVFVNSMIITKLVVITCSSLLIKKLL